MTSTTTTTTATTTGPTTATTGHRYVVPGRSDLVTGRVIAWLVRHGVGVAGARLLTVPGRRTGEPRTTVVNVLELDGERYLVSPRGRTQWARNLAAAGRAELRVGRRIEEVTAHEVDDLDKAAVLRPYLDRWGWEVGRFTDGLSADSSDEDLVAAAPGFPVFRLVAA